MNICLCGAQASYPHRMDCPFPYFGNDDEGMARWQKAQRTGDLHRKGPGQTPLGLQRREGVVVGCGEPNCSDCYEPCHCASVEPLDHAPIVCKRCGRRIAARIA